MRRLNGSGILQIVLPEETAKIIEAMAVNENRSESNLGKILIEAGLKKQGGGKDA